MKKTMILSLVFSLCTTYACATQTTQQAGSPVKLYDGSTLNGWGVTGNANWQVVQGAIQGNSGNGFLITEKSFQNFVLKLEFWADKETNSGVFIRCSDANNITDTNCYEVNIFDTRPDPTFRTGSIVNVAKPLAIINSEGHWNTLEVVAQGTHLLVRLNGTVTVDIHDSKLTQGPIAFQYAKGGIKFRNLDIFFPCGEQVGPDATGIKGVWDLTGFDLVDGKGNTQPWCESSYGSIAYAHGYMFVAINCESDSSKMVQYSGPYHVEGDTVVHNVRNFGDPKLKQIFRRQIQMPSSDQLNLVGPFGDGGKAVISWQRRECH